MGLSTGRGKLEKNEQMREEKLRKHKRRGKVERNNRQKKE